MGCLNSFYESFMKKYKANQTKEKNHFDSMKNGLQKSIENINATLKPVKDWENLLSLNSEEEFFDEKEEEHPQEDTALKKSKTTAYIKPKISCCYSMCLKFFKKFKNSKCCSFICLCCGFIFCLIQLIGVQAGIIILNALFNEIFDAFKISSKEYNFYEKIEIASYKSIPEIDVGMFWSFIGIIVLKKYGFKVGSIFQILSSIGLLLLFILFDFHTSDKLLIHYTNLEYTVLVLSYIGLSISIGASSTLALKQFFNLYKKYYQIYFDFNIIFNILPFCYYKCFRAFLNCISACLNCFEKKSENNSNNDEEEKSRKEVESIENELYKKEEKEIYNEEEENKEEEEKRKKIEENNKEKEIKDEETIRVKEEEEQNNNTNNNNEEEEKDKNIEQIFFFNFSTISSALIIAINRKIFNSFKNITSKNIFWSILIVYFASFILSLPFYGFFSIPLINRKINNKIFKERKEKEKERKKNKIKAKNIKVARKKIRDDNDNAQIDYNRKLKLFESENVGLKNKLLNKETNKSVKNQVTEIDSKSEIINIKLNIDDFTENKKNKELIKVCTCVGYVYFQKKIGNRKACIFYDYDSCFSWFWFKIYKFEIIFPFFVELYLQLCVCGFNSILSENLLKEYSFSKNIRFFSSLILSVFFVNLYLILVRKMEFFALNKNLEKSTNNINNDDDNNNNINNNDNNFNDNNDINNNTNNNINNNNDNNNNCNIFKYCNELALLIYFLLAISLIFLIISFKYIFEDNPTGDKWDNLYMNSIIFFKAIDFQLLSFYDFLDDEDCLNTTIIIYFEKFLWMIIEIVIDLKEIKIKVLIIIQIIFSLGFFIALILISILMLFCYIKKIIEE